MVRSTQLLRSSQNYRLAVATVFFVQGAMLASWASRIPAVQTKLHLSTGQLGTAMLGSGVGSLLTMPLWGSVAARLGSRVVVMVGLIIMGVALALLAAAPSAFLLWAALALLGIGGGAVDIAMNTQAVAVETMYGRPIMPSFHGLWSLGSMTGAALGGALAGAHVDLLSHLTGSAVLFSGIGLLAAGIGMIPFRLDQHRVDAAMADGMLRGVRQAVISRPLLALGAITFCAMFSEGTLGDWSAVYLHRTLATTQQLAADGLAASALAMAVGRFLGDGIVHRYGSVPILRFCGLLSAAGLLLSITVSSAGAAIVGFALVGIGLSVVVPITFSAAGNLPGLSAGPSIAAVSTLGYTAFFVGPPLIGYLAEAIHLRNALAVGVIACLLVAALAGSVKSAQHVTP